MPTVRQQSRINLINQLNINPIFYPSQQHYNLAVMVVVLCHIAKPENPERVYNWLRGRINAGEFNGIVDDLRKALPRFKSLNTDEVKK
jgi:hypothetical protein